MKRPHPVELTPSPHHGRIWTAVRAGCGSALLGSIARCRTFMGSALVGSAVLVGVPAHAAVVLDWSAPPECPQEEDVRRKLSALAGDALERGVELHARAHVEKADGKYRLRLQVRDRGEVLERVIESHSCADLAGAGAVALVLLLQEGEASSDGASPAEGGSGADEGNDDAPSVGAPGEGREGQRDPLEPAEPYPTIWEMPPRARTSGVSLLLRVPSGAFELGPLPGPSASFGAGAGIRADGWRFVATGRLSLEKRLEPAEPDGVGTRIRRSTATLSACRSFTPAPWEASPCLLLGLEHVEATGFGVDVEPRAAQRWWLAPGAEFTLHVHVAEWIQPFAAVSGQIEVERPHFQLVGLGDIGVLSPFAFGAVLGADWIF